MEHASWLLQTFVFLGAAVISVPIAKRLGLSSVLGYLIAGALIGPHLFGWLGEPGDVMHVAEFGVVIMLFLVGLEIRPSYLWQMRGAILGLGGAQVLGCGAIGCALGLAAGLGWRSGLAIGLILSSSSTAIVLQALREKGIANSPPGRAAFSVLLFQDIAVIPLLAVLPLLALDQAANVAAHTGALMALPNWLRPLLVLAAVISIAVAGRFATGPIFRFIANSGLREMFTAAALALVVGVALLMELVGLSPALGAFVAGVVLADSEFRHELEANIEPFRALLLGLFFISVGASIDFALLARQPGLILLLVMALLISKTAVMFGLARLFRSPAADAVLLALALAQGGEFAFVLFAFANTQNVLPASITAPLVAAVAISMAATPLLLMLADRLRQHLAPPQPATAVDEAIISEEPHVLIAGFGRFGQIVARVLHANGFRTSVLDQSADQVNMVRSYGNKANYGDASRIDLLHAAGAGTASVLVIAIDEPDKALEIAENARKHFPQLRILARAFDRRHAYKLYRLGVEVVQRETFESALSMGVDALRALGMRAHQARRAATIFARHDQRLLMELAFFEGDEKSYRLELSRATAQSEELMRRDFAIFHGGAGADVAFDAQGRDHDRDHGESSQLNR